MSRHSKLVVQLKIWLQLLACVVSRENLLLSVFWFSAFSVSFPRLAAFKIFIFFSDAEQFREALPLCSSRVSSVWDFQMCVQEAREGAHHWRVCVALPEDPTLVPSSHI